MATNDSIQKLAHDMKGFLSCWREWKMPGSPFRLTDRGWFADFARRADELASRPLRNCDVGTAEEQAERFARYCGTEVCKRKRCKTRPKALVIDACALCWAQMPYAEEGGAK